MVGLDSPLMKHTTVASQTICNEPALGNGEAGARSCRVSLSGRPSGNGCQRHIQATRSSPLLWEETRFSGVSLATPCWATFQQIPQARLA